jgi:hypothetical protein
MNRQMSPQRKALSGDPAGADSDGIVIPGATLTRAPGPASADARSACGASDPLVRHTVLGPRRACPGSSAGLSSAAPDWGAEGTMASDDGRETGARRRRERLAASLRENLKRRKAQQRERARAGAPAGAPASAEPAPDGASATGEPQG